MKRILTLFMAMLICLSLAACSSADAQRSYIGNVTDSDITVHIKINPAFDIYVDNGGVITGISLLNSDAEKVCRNLDIVYCEYKEGVKQLLKAVYDNGYIEPDTKIELQLSMKSTAEYDIFRATDSVIADFTADVAHVEFDITSEIENIIQQGQPEENTERENLVGDNAQVLERDETGRPIKLALDSGEIVEYTFDSDGEVATQTIHGLDNTLQILTYSGDFLQSRFNRDSEGVEVTLVYHPDGTVKTKQIVSAGYGGGTVTITESYSTDGVLLQRAEHDSATNQTYTYSFDANGNPAEIYGYDNLGRPVHTVYNADGSYTVRTTNADGTITVSRWDAGNNMLSSELE